MKRPLSFPYYWVNDIATLHWEIVGPDGYVHTAILKTADDDNRDEAERKAANLNRRHGRKAPPKNIEKNTHAGSLPAQSEATL